MNDWPMQEFFHLIRTEHFADLHVVVDGQTFNCHKVFMSSISMYFRNLLITDSRETQIVHLDNVKAEVFKKFRNFVYNCGDPTSVKFMSSEMLIELHECGETLLVPYVSAQCLKELCTRSGTYNLRELINVFDQAHTLKIQELINVIESKLQDRFGKHLFCARALKLDSYVFVKYLTLSQGYISELERFKMLEIWITMQEVHRPGTPQSLTDSRSDSDLVDLFRHINFNLLSEEESNVGPEISEWYNQIQELNQNSVSGVDSASDSE